MKISEHLSDKQFRALLMLLMLVAAWLLWSGLFKPLLLFLGAFSCAVTIFMVQRMDRLDGNQLSINFNMRFFGYWFWLAIEVVKSSLQVARVVLNPKLPISPRYIEIDAKALSTVDQVILGNSITLTPGTLTIDLHQGIIKAHSLTKEGADDLMSGEMLRRVQAIRKAN